MEEIPLDNLCTLVLPQRRLIAQMTGTPRCPPLPFSPFHFMVYYPLLFLTLEYSLYLTPLLGTHRLCIWYSAICETKKKKREVFIHSEYCHLLSECIANVLAVQWISTAFPMKRMWVPMERMWVRFPVRELRSHTPCSAVKGGKKCLLLVSDSFFLHLPP